MRQRNLLGGRRAPGDGARWIDRCCVPRVAVDCCSKRGKGPLSVAHLSFLLRYNTTNREEQTGRGEACRSRERARPTGSASRHRPNLFHPFHAVNDPSPSLPFQFEQPLEVEGEAGQPHQISTCPPSNPQSCAAQPCFFFLDHATPSRPFCPKTHVNCRHLCTPLQSADPLPNLPDYHGGVTHALRRCGLRGPVTRA